MLPIALLGSTVYIVRRSRTAHRLSSSLPQGLQLVQSHLARERYLDQANARVEALENELSALTRPAPGKSPRS